jgi:hypothetical protein
MTSIDVDVASTTINEEKVNGTVHHEETTIQESYSNDIDLRQLRHAMA